MVRIKTKVDVKIDNFFKMLFSSKKGIRYMCSILSDLLNIDYNDLVNNIELCNTEYVRNKKNIKSSFSDIVYRYKNNIIILEMNNRFRNRDIYKNHFYLMFNQIKGSYNKNDYNKEQITYLIDIDNFDIVKKLNIDMESKFIYKSELKINKTLNIIYPNIKTIRINLDYLKKIQYNYNILSNIERNCLIFIENDIEILKNETKNKDIEGVIEMYKIIEKDGDLYTIFDREKYEALVMEDMKEEAREEGMKHGIEQGKNSEKILIAKNLKDIGLSVEKIETVTNLSKENILKL